MKDEQILKTVEEITNDFLTQMGLDADVKVTFAEAEASDKDLVYIEVRLEGENLNELIGHHGINLESAQTVLGLMVSKKTERRDVRVLVEINDYKEGRERYLKSYALRAADQVRSSGQSMELMPMKPSERRIIHIVLKEEADIETDSTGEGDDRRVVIKKKD